MREDTVRNVRAVGKTESMEKDGLPPGLFVGVIPEDGVQASLKHWLVILEIDPEEEATFLKQLRRDGFKPKRFCRNPFIPASVIRRQIDSGNGELGGDDA